MRAILGVLPALALAGCGLFQTQPAVTKVECPYINEYTPEFQAQVLGEFDEAKKSGLPLPGLHQMIADYGNERDRLRACHLP
jgi:hypothetical protein